MTYKDPLEVAIDIRRFAIEKSIRYWDGQGDRDDVIGFAVDIENYIVTGQLPILPDATPEEDKQYAPPWEGTPESIYKNWFNLGGA